MSRSTYIERPAPIRWGVWLGIVGLTVLVAPRTSGADPKGAEPGARSPAPPTGGDVRPAAACPALFGRPGLRAANAQARAQQLDFVEEDESGVTIAHCVETWEEPNALRFSELTFVGVRGDAAIFEVAPRLAAAMGCRAGRYALEVDDAISKESRVLAVLRRAVLVEQRGALRYLIAPGERPLSWLTAWRLRGAFGPTYDPSVTYTPPPTPIY